MQGAVLCPRGHCETGLQLNRSHRDDFCSLLSAGEGKASPLQHALHCTPVGLSDLVEAAAWMLNYLCTTPQHGKALSPTLPRYQADVTPSLPVANQTYVRLELGLYLEYGWEAEQPSCLKPSYSSLLFLAPYQHQYGPNLPRSSPGIRPLWWSNVDLYH